ncbi:MAG: SDR family NAD(P)-dependent oxidoreductase [Rhodospirillales bacterium]|nr:MAG: SDR family NAD(P)-dependent oxidoreductase [Rhodospirillales bacterium]
MSRIVWLTGASKGLGRAVAVALAQRGDTVAASARTQSDLESLAQELSALPGEIHPFPLDVGDAAATLDVVDAIEERLGPIDLAILNAGTHQPVRATEFSVEPFRTLVEVNLMGTVNGLAALLPRFCAQRRGHVAVVASVAGYRGLPTAGAYGATKAALINMCEALKPELDRAGVRISVINPGFVRTPLTDRNPFPMPFLMEPDDAAQRLVRGLDSRRFEITFPRRFTWTLKLLRCLPYALYFPLTRRLVQRQ